MAGDAAMTQPPMVWVADRIGAHKRQGYEVVEMAESGAHDGDVITVTLTLRRPAKEAKVWG